MAHMNRTRRLAGYGHSLYSPQPFPIQNTEWGTEAWRALYGGTHSTEPVNSSVQHGVYGLIPPAISVENGSREPLYMPTGAVQSTPENWASQSIVHPDSTPFYYSPSFVPATSTPTSQSPIPNAPPLSTDPPGYTWVPQRRYTLTAHHFTPANPILFNVDFGEPGIRLIDAFHRRFTHLRDRDDLVFESSRSPTITMRLEWPGYTSWSRQVRILDSRSVRQSISREKLAYEVAKTIMAFAQPQNGKKSSAESAPDRNRMWAICDDNIGLEDLVLVSVDNVSKGSWQPQFLVRRRPRN